MLSQFLFNSLNAYFLSVEFLCAAGLVVLSGVKVAAIADELADKLGLSHAWMGIFVLSMVTSLPELVSSIGAVVFIRGPNLAFGNIFGANMFNMVIICFLDIAYRSPQSIFSVVSPRHILTASLGIIIMGVAVLGIVLMPLVAGSYLTLFSLLIIIIYLWGTRLIFKHEHPEVIPLEREFKPIRQTLFRFLGWAVVIVISGVWLTYLADMISAVPFSQIILGHNLVGSTLLAVVTSLPELVVSIWAIKLGSFDMAIGNIFGSSVCNVFFIPILEAIYVYKYRVSIFEDVSQTHIFTALMAIILTSVAIAGLIYESKYKKKIIGWEALILGGLYLVGVIVLYQLR